MRLILITVILLMQTTALVGHEKQALPEHKADIAKLPPSTVEKSTVLDNSAASEKQGTSDEKSKWWVPPPPWDIYWPTIGLVIITGFAVRYAVKTLEAINAQVVEMRATGEQTDKLIRENIAQSESMQRSVAEASRLASAMEKVAGDIAVSSKAAVDSVETLRERTAQQMRAYLTVIIGAGVFQERNKGFKFEGKPLLINTGHTPARRVSLKTSAAILSVPLPDDFAFPVSSEITSTATVGAQQNANLSGIVDDFIDDADVEDIKIGKAKRCLYVWGVVTYEDIFGQSHFTKFCQTLFWTLDGKSVYGYYYPRHNEAT